MEIFCEYNVWADPYTCSVISVAVKNPCAEIEAIHGNHRKGKTDADIRQIYFQKDILNFIPKGVNIFFPNLTILDMGNCRLKEICRKDLTGLDHLEHLLLSKNRLTSLPDDLFMNTKKLIRISFFANEIEFMSSNLFKPIIKNKFEFVDFQKNAKIDAFYRPRVPGSETSINDLLQIIDSNCCKPKASKNSGDLTKITKKVSSTHHENSRKGFKNLLNSGEFSDFTIVINGLKRLYVHKCILVAQSERFAELFAKDPDATEMNIEGLSPEGVEEFFRFLYFGEFHETSEKVMEVFALASKIKVEGLIEILTELVLNKLNNTNALKIFSLAHSFQSDELKKAAFKVMQKMFPERQLPEYLIDDLPKVRKVIAAKEKLDIMMEQFENLKSD